MRKKILIRGNVHEVGYRPFLLGLAESLEIKRFYADNIYVDGEQAVEILLEDEEEKVQRFIELTRERRPEGAEVKEISVEDYEGGVMPTESYYRYLTAAQLSKIIEYGRKMLGKQDDALGKMDLMLGKQDEMLGKMDLTLGKQDEMLRRQDEMLRKQDEMLGKQDEMLKRQDLMLEKQDMMLKKQDMMLEKQDETSEKIGEVVGEIRDLRADLRSLLEDRLAKIERDIAEIKARLGML